VSGRYSGRGLAIAVGLAVLWGSAAAGVYLELSSHRSGVARQAARPGEAAAAVNPALARLPGTLYLVQDGALYRLQQGRFTAILQPGGWSQPAALPGGGGVILVRRDPSGFSDLYRADAAGKVQQLTHDQGRGAAPGPDPGTQVVTQYWAMHPRVSADGKQLYFVTDRYKHVRCCPFDVTMRVAQMPLAGGTPKFWTVDAVTQTATHTEDGDYAGGDAEPLPLASGPVLFVRYAYAGNKVGSSLMVLRQPMAAPVALTAPDDLCDEPALSPDGTRLAMVCSTGKQTTTVQVAAFDGNSLGPRQVVVSGVQAARPVWSPDGTQLTYLAPVGMTGHFQLWSTAAPTALPTPVPVPTRPATRGRATAAAAAPSPPAPASPSQAAVAPPVQLTDNLDFDATSSIAWAG
jgi:hypothetical protein